MSSIVAVLLFGAYMVSVHDDTGNRVSFTVYTIAVVVAVIFDFLRFA
jgi:hypothetical protein